MSYSVAQPLSERRELNLGTWQLFLLVLVANLIATWLYNDHILTRELYHNLLSDRLESSRIDEYFDFLHKVSRWGYLAQPVILWIQISFIVLLIQMPLLLFFIDIPYRRLFRIVTWCALAMIAAAFSRIIWLSLLQASEITQETLNMVPLSINSFLDSAEYHITTYAVLGKFNIFELLWCIMLYKGLSATEKLKKDNAALLVFILWTVLLLFQWGVSAYFNGVD